MLHVQPSLKRLAGAGVRLPALSRHTLYLFLKEHAYDCFNTRIRAKKLLVLGRFFCLAPIDSVVAFLSDSNDG